MSTIRKRGSSWQAQVRRRGITQSKTFIQRADAQRWANETERDADRRGLRDNQRILERMTAGDILKRFRDERIPIRRYAQKEGFMLNALLRAGWTQLPLSQLASGSIAAFRDARLKTVKASTVTRELGLAQHILEVARLEWDVPLDSNPIRLVRKPQADPCRERRISDNEINALLIACHRAGNSLLKPLALLALETAMRRGELLNARWKHVDWSTSTLLIPVTKNGEPRTIPLSTEAKNVLAGLAVDWWDEAPIFPLSAEAVSLGWRRLTKRAGVVDLNFHDLRHEAISRFFERGLSIPEVALISGHKDPRMLFRYTHLRAADVARKLNDSS